MKKRSTSDLRPEYRRQDLGTGVRGKHYRAYREGTNLVLLRPEIAAAFPTPKAVNDALASLLPEHPTPKRSAKRSRSR